MRISDWSSDVCSSDLLDPLQEEMGADQRADESAEAVEGLAERQAEMAALRVAERRGERVRRDLQHGDAARQHEQAEQHERIDREIGSREHDEAAADHRRSEQHTSELQSLMRISYAVFCL